MDLTQGSLHLCRPFTNLEQFEPQVDGHVVLTLLFESSKDEAQTSDSVGRCVNASITSFSRLRARW